MQCSHVPADKLSLLQTNPFFSVVGIYLETHDRDTQRDDVNHRCLGYKTPLSFARQRPSLLTRLKKKENGRCRMANGNLLFFSFTYESND